MYLGIRFLFAIWISIAGVQFSFAQNISFKDLNFKKALIDHGFDCNGDGEIDQREALLVESIDVQHRGISSLDEISFFLNLTKLFCSSNPSLKALDVSANVKLKLLCCSNTEIAYMNLSKNVDLVKLECAYTALTSLDVSQNIKLEELYCGEHDLRTINVSQDLDLENFYCDGAKVSVLRVSKEAALISLDCPKNPEPHVGVSLCANLIRLTHGKARIWESLKKLPELSDDKRRESSFNHHREFTSPTLAIMVVADYQISNGVFLEWKKPRGNRSRVNN